MHWTQIEQRSGKIGVIPSNILAYDNNPINNVWIKVRIKHSYMATASNQLSITSNEKLQIYGCLNEDGMIKARQKELTYTYIPTYIKSHLKNIYSGSEGLIHGTFSIFHPLKHI